MAIISSSPLSFHFMVATTITSVLFLLLHPTMALLRPDNDKDNSNVLFSDQALTTDQRLSYGKYNLVMQKDCNLVLENGNWQSGTAGEGKRCRLVLRNDGRLRIEDVSNGNREVWTSKKSGSSNGEYVAVVHPEGKVVVYGPAVWQRPARKASSLFATSRDSNCQLLGKKKSKKLGNIPEVSNALFSEQVLYNGGKLSSRGENQEHELVMREDCNLVLNNGDWQTDTNGNGEGCFLRLDRHGGLTIKDDLYSTVWSNHVRSKKGEYVAVLKDDGMFVVFGPEIWSTDNDEGIKMVV